MSESEPQETHSAGETSAKASGGPLSVLFPADIQVWNEARRLVGDKNIRVEDLATVASQDPVVVLDLLKVSNAMFFSGGKSPITSTKTAIVRLGSDTVVDILEKMKDRPRIESEEVSHWFEIHRSRCRRAAIISRILGEALSRTLADDCQAAGLMLYIGEMLAVYHLGDRYVTIAEQLSRSGVNYRLSQEFKFDVEMMGLSYLRRYGIPEALLFAIDREARSRSPERSIMKPLCMAAAEVVEAFDSNRWDKLAPGKTLAPKSSLRMLQIPDQQYLKIYERCSEYLFSARLQDEKKKQEAAKGVQFLDADALAAAPQAAAPEPASSDDLQNDIQNLLKGIETAQGASAPAPETPPPSPASTAPSPQAAPQKPSSSAPSAAPSGPARKNLEEQYGLESARGASARPARSAEEAGKRKKAHSLITPRGKEVMQSVSDLLSAAKSGEELLAQLLDKLVTSGTFEKTALIVVSRDRKRAVVVAARGPSIGNGQTLALDDPLSPLAQCFTKVQSFGIKANAVSPWGSKSFALAPVDADHDTPVALYADCGSKGAVTFEARRIFRTVVEALNERLPQIPGGIPVEI